MHQDFFNVLLVQDRTSNSAVIDYLSYHKLGCEKDSNQHTQAGHAYKAVALTRGSYIYN